MLDRQHVKKLNFFKFVTTLPCREYFLAFFCHSVVAFVQGHTTIFALLGNVLCFIIILMVFSRDRETLID